MCWVGSDGGQERKEASKRRKSQKKLAPTASRGGRVREVGGWILVVGGGGVWSSGERGVETDGKKEKMK